MAAPRLSAPVGLREVLQMMGKAVTKIEMQRLRRLIQQRERTKDVQILFHSARGKFHTTLAVLRTHMPDLFESVDLGPVVEAMTELRSKIDDMEEELEELRERDSIIAKQFKLKLQDLKRPQTTSRSSFG